jgi:hypothetical protein
MLSRLTQQEGDVDPVSAGAESGPEGAPRACAWCGTPAPSPDATACASCGAALAQRESIGEVAIPGLTAVDAALQDYDKRPLHLRGPSPSQGMAPAIIVGAMAGGPIGLAAIGGVAAVAAAEYMGAGRGGGGSLDEVGKPSEVALQALQHLDERGASRADGAEDNARAGTQADPAERDAAADDGGRSIWRDLPPVAGRNERHEWDQEEGSADGH